MSRIPSPPYHHGHARSKRAKYDRSHPPQSLRGLVAWARDEYALEGPPLALHEGFTHIGDDGSPRMRGAFVRYLTIHPAATDPSDPAYYERPLHAALWKMQRHSPADASVALAVANGLYSASEAVAWVVPTLPPEWRARNAAAALEKLWRTYSEVRIEAPKWTELSESQQRAEGGSAA